jgi:hypothetical protein
MMAALLLMARQLETASGSGWPGIAAGGAIASLAVATALQAVHGIALRRMMIAWSNAPPAQKEVAFYAALAVRQVEVGLASTLSLVLGLTVTAYGMALLADRAFRNF